MLRFALQWIERKNKICWRQQFLCRMDRSFTVLTALNFHGKIYTHFYVLITVSAPSNFRALACHTRAHIRTRVRLFFGPLRVLPAIGRVKTKRAFHPNLLSIDIYPASSAHFIRIHLVTLVSLSDTDLANFRIICFSAEGWLSLQHPSSSLSSAHRKLVHPTKSLWYKNFLLSYKKIENFSKNLNRSELERF